MGAVWRALDRDVDKQVAIKVLPTRLTYHKQYRERFLREAAALGLVPQTPVTWADWRAPLAPCVGARDA